MSTAEYSEIPVSSVSPVEASGAAPAAAASDQADKTTIHKVVNGLHSLNKGGVGVEANSVYGAAVLMPQLARSCGWPEELISLTISSYVYLFLCIIVHSSVLVFMIRSDRVSDGFGGQPYLCDFGANANTCTEGDPHCMGPGGTTIVPARIYSWGQWATRVYLRDSLLAVFPTSADSVHKNVDPGEYGLESYNCRLLCVFVFLMSVIQEMYLIVRMLKFLYHVPSENQPWVETSGDVKDGEITLENIKVRAAGMSLGWKFSTFMLVLVPKAILWGMTVDTGVSFLMETAAIDDIIVNSVALGFLLCMDEAIVDGLMSAQANYLLENCEDYAVPHPPEGPIDPETDKSIFLRLPKALLSMLTTSCFKLILTFLLTIVFVLHYYSRHCDWDGERFVSKTVHLPASTDYNVLNALLPQVFPVAETDDLVWTMPK